MRTVRLDCSCQLPGNYGTKAPTTLSFAMVIPIYRSLHSLWARNPQKVSKRCSRPSRPGVSKKCRKVPNDPKKSQKTTKSVFGDFFDTFLTLRAGNTFLRLFGDFRPRGPRDSCIRRLQSQPKLVNSLLLGKVHKNRFGKSGGGMGLPNLELSVAV